jgi:hypothetical protein
MSKLLKTALMTAFAASCIAGASATFAANNGGHAGSHGGKDNKCSESNMSANSQDSNANCTR